MDALLVCVPLSHVHGRQSAGDFQLDAHGRLHRGGDMVYGGAQIMKTDLLHEVDTNAFSLNIPWNMIAKRDRLFGLSYPGQWCDVGHPEGIEIAEQILRDYHV